MRISLEQHEMMLIDKLAAEFTKKTGERASRYYIIALLRLKYEDNFQKDLEQVLDQKLREIQEQNNKA